MNITWELGELVTITIDNRPVELITGNQLEIRVFVYRFFVKLKFFIFIKSVQKNLQNLIYQKERE
ncbi:hypothetical protein ES705_30039 [subsurface metagenome]